MKKTILYILFTFTSILSHAIYFNHIGVKDGLAQLSVLSIHQDKLGRIWFGTMEGLSIYNGWEAESYKGVGAQPWLTIDGEKITNITEDKHGDIFFMTNDNGLMKYDFRQHIFINFNQLQISALSSIDGVIHIAAQDTIYTWNDISNRFDPKLVTGLPHKITKIFKDQQQQWWIGTLDGLYKISMSDKPVCVIPDKEIWEIFESSKKELWIGTRLQGMFKIDTEQKVTEFLHNPAVVNTISSNQVRTFVEDANGDIWIGTFEGLNKYNLQTGAFTVYKNNYLPGSLSHSSIFSLLIDRQGSFWIGSFYGGVNFFNPQKEIFTYYGVDPLRDNCLNYPFGGNMVEDNDHNLWICTEGGGLNMLDRKTNRFKYYTTDGGDKGPLHNNLKSICYDSKGNQLYVGTHTGGVSRYDMTTRKFRNYLNETASDGLSHAILLQTVFYKGDIYFQDNHGLFKMDGKTSQITPLFPPESFDRYTGVSFIIDSKGYLWISTLRNYIARLNLNDLTEQIKEFYFQQEYHTSKSLRLFESKNGDIYVTTLGLGLLRLDRQTGLFDYYTAEKGQLLSNYCYDVAESSLGHLIVIGDKGISILDPQKGLLKSISISRLVPISSFNRGNAVLVCKNGEVFVSTTEGLISFFEEDLYSEDLPYNLYFGNLIVNNKEILPNDGSHILKEILAYTSQISLNHNQNNITITFADNDYANSYNPREYQYKLVGLDDEWVSTDKFSVEYTNLPSGKYTLKVKTQNVYSQTNKQWDEIELAIVVRAPFYATTFAWVVYTLLFASLLYAFIYFRQRQIRLEASLQYERKEKQYITTLNKTKLSFFTRISHEFRTPLTLIITQIEMLLQEGVLTKSVSDKIRSIYKNSYRMRNLVNEILDFQKMEDVKNQLRVYHADIVPVLQDIFSSFKEKAQSKEIKYNFQSSSSKIYCWFDPDQLQKVFYNLLSNAFSYTPSKGSIELIVYESPDEIIIKVIDNGVGMEKADIKNIFDQFYQASNNVKAENPYLTTGVGLAICKEIVDLHQGKISVKSMLDYGSIFTVSLKKDVKHFENNDSVKIIRDGYEAIKQDTLPVDDFVPNYLPDAPIKADAPAVDKSYSILIVEDNEELSELLESIFSPFYNVAIAYNGKEGLQKAMDNMPDIILSDIMMPEMDGTELCLRIKNNINTSHIPVVLLTAKTSDEQNLEGLQKGADDYITKPFNAKILLTRCNNLIQNRLRQQQKFRSTDTVDMQLLANNKMDQIFLEKVEKIIEDNLANSAFDINALAREVAMGRSSLFAKFKLLAGIGPNEFILNYKLKRAAFMLKNNSNLQITDVADEFGFSSARYFSRCFKLQFNMSPNEYRKPENSTEVKG